MNLLSGNHRLKAMFQWMMLVVGIVLTTSIFRSANIQNTLSTLAQADYRPVIPVFAVTIVAHVLRARRWALMLSEPENKVALTTALSAIITGYFVNIFVPRLGEITRCVTLSTHTQLPITKILGTVGAERITDLICLALLFLSVLLLQQDLLTGVLHEFFIPFFSGLLQSKPWLPYVGAGALILVLLAVWKLSDKYTEKSATGAARSALHLKNGMLSPLKKHTRFAYLLLTAGIWLCYFLMTYLWFECFEQTSLLPVKAGLGIMAMGSLAKTVPIQAGGMGAYHTVVVATFALYNIPAATALALAVIIHGFQLLFSLMAGITVLGFNAFSNGKSILNSEDLKNPKSRSHAIS